MNARLALLRRCLVSVLILSPALAVAAETDHWPQFRGPGGQGHSDATDLPLKWSEAENVAWKAPVAGRGWSSPVVQDGRIWITTALEKDASLKETAAAMLRIGMPVPSPKVAGELTLKAICLDAATGKTIHDVTLLEIDEPAIMCRVNSFASPTPVLEEGRVYCDFGDLGTACLDAANGKTLWQRRLKIEHQVGSGSSATIYGDYLILVRDGCHVQYVTALDKRTGKTEWKADRPPIDSKQPPFCKAFSTPLVIEAGGRRQMVIPAAQWITAYDPENGDPLWRVDTGGTFSNTARPVFGHGLVYICTAFGGSRLLAIRPDGKGDVTRSHVAWEVNKQIPKRSSPVLVGDELYIVADNGVATCLDAKSGKTHWTERLSGPHSASPLYAADRIYFCGEDGVTTVVEPGTSFKQLAENKLDGQIMASPAVVGDAIILRTDTHLYRVE